MSTLKEIRLSRFLSQADLAKLADMTVATINRLEKGKHKPALITIRKLAAALGVEPGEIDF